MAGSEEASHWDWVKGNTGQIVDSPLDYCLPDCRCVADDQRRVQCEYTSREQLVGQEGGHGGDV